MERDVLVTPEAVVLGLPEAGLPSRIVAAGIDLGVQVLAVVVATLGAQQLLGGLPTVAVQVGLSLLVFLARIVYPTVAEWRYGATVGHGVMGLRVVTSVGGPPTLRQTATRTAVGIVELEGTGGLLALLTAVFDRRGRRLGDLAAGTVVVRRRAGEEARAVSATVPAGLRGWVGGLDLDALDADDRAALRRFLVRRDALPAAGRRELADRLLRAVLPRVGAAVPDGVAPEAAALALAAAAGGGAAAASPASLGGARPPDPEATSPGARAAPPPPPPPSGAPAPGPRPSSGDRPASGFVPPA